jgi:8-oxo-dGTP diphosphatase
MKKIVQVVIGIVANSQQEVLLAWRDAHKVPGNCWEFPGGKIEAGETVYQALCRELFEEIKAQLLESIYHDYEAMGVRLHPCRVQEYSGTPRGVEGQIIQWIPLENVPQLVLPSANYALVDLLLKMYSK